MSRKRAWLQSVAVRIQDSASSRYEISRQVRASRYTGVSQLKRTTGGRGTGVAGRRRTMRWSSLMLNSSGGSDIGAGQRRLAGCPHYPDPSQRSQSSACLSSPMQCHASRRPRFMAACGCHDQGYQAGGRAPPGLRCTLVLAPVPIRTIARPSAQRTRFQLRGRCRGTRGAASSGDAIIDNSGTVGHRRTIQTGTV